jgi:hypothetical protein
MLQCGVFVSRNPKSAVVLPVKQLPAPAVPAATTELHAPGAWPPDSTTPTFSDLSALGAAASGPPVACSATCGTRVSCGNASATRASAGCAVCPFTALKAPVKISKAARSSAVAHVFCLLPNVIAISLIIGTDRRPAQQHAGLALL